MSTLELRCWACGGPVQPGPSAQAHCRACGLEFTPSADPARLAELHDEHYFEIYAGEGYAGTAAAQREREAALRLRWLHRATTPPGRLLEVGSAAGHFLHAADAAGWTVSGIEPGFGGVGSPALPAGAVQDATLEGAVLPEGELDAVCAFHVLEHIVAPLAQLIRLRGALRAEGMLLIEVPNAGSVAARRLGEDWPVRGLPWHVTQFGRDSLHALLEHAGFTDVRTATVPFCAYDVPAAAPLQRRLAHRTLLSVRLRAFGREHAWKHELLRATARVP